jgi:hypothetical protein
MAKSKEIAPQPEADPAIAAAETSLSTAAKIRSYVLNGMGHPADFMEVAIRKLWNGHYRANVLTGSSSVDVRIVHSFFLQVGTDGEVLSASPRVTRLYPDK